MTGGNLLRIDLSPLRPEAGPVSFTIDYEASPSNALRASVSRDDDPVTTLDFRCNERIDSAIRFTVNEIIKIPGSAFMPALIQDAPALKAVGKQVFDFALGGFPQLSLFDVTADDNFLLQRFCVTLLHRIHKPCRCAKRWFVNEVIVIAERRRAGDEDAEEEQE